MTEGVALDMFSSEVVRFRLDDLDAVCERKKRVRDDSERLEHLSGWYLYL